MARCSICRKSVTEGPTCGHTACVARHELHAERAAVFAALKVPPRGVQRVAELRPKIARAERRLAIPREHAPPVEPVQPEPVSEAAPPTESTSLKETKATKISASRKTKPTYWKF
jgi:hypothetical protein